ncbi:MAG: ATP synthase F0 subunit C [Deltaproteobacteria bacterium]|nr:ATP synthase F0 subunit C [Deltaproteobacteria bacterium]MCL4233310.1 ATP synthase F0 subunit C [Deltaproteobacteria bacterium]
MNKRMLTLTLFVLFTFAMATTAFAQGLSDDVKKNVALAAGFGIAVAAFGGAFGQGRAAAAALEGIARNPAAAQKLFTPLILSLALIESLVIYALVISFLLVFKL